MENTETLNIRISRELKQSLEKQARENNQSVSDYVRDLLTRDVLQDGDGVSGIPPDLMEKLKVEAQRRAISTTDLIARLVVAGFGRLRKTGSPNLFIIE